MMSPAARSEIPCPVCGSSIAIRSAKGRKSGKPFILLVCPVSGHHFRAFIGDPDYVARVRGALMRNHD